MGLCASMLPWKAKRGQPEPRRSTPKVLFIVRNDGRQSKPEALVFHTHSYGGSGLQKPGRTDSRKHAKCGYDCTDLLCRRLRAPKPPRLPCGSTRSVAVEPMAADKRRPPMSSGATVDGRAAAAGEGCRTPTTPRRTPVWQRRILMGTRCELPRFSGLILYDELGRPLQSSSQNRAGHLISRASKYESKGKRKNARTTPTLRDLL
ncbi:hypothetical protein PAHAL_1G169700 [Panicum hallii]|uniref:Uncharacterized protein n=1 Tax=Panicum hallii TaxID=206008 RepID=A0A2S3GP49_9POAL|nr:uncharacterized protein LOC112878499 [Panicum hallii]PAN05591.1 hypothetical protein PAHAL_1G169700 [Panicum hallii]